MKQPIFGSSYGFIVPLDKLYNILFDKLTAL